MATIEVELERVVAQAAEDDRFSGVMLIARGSDIVFIRSYNYACRRFGVKNQIDTRFDIASLGKMFTGVAIGQVVEEGLLSFSAPLSRYLPEYPSEISERVTIHHLLTHTSGLGSIFDGGWDIASQARFRTFQEIIPHFRDRPLLFEPGAAWEYSNAGYILLGAVIEAITGRSYFDYIQEHIFTPAGMYDTGPYSLDEDVPNLAYASSRLDPSDEEDAEPRWNNVFRHWTVSTPAGCVFSTVFDLLQFSLALTGGKLVSTTMVRQLTEAKVPTGQRLNQNYAYGFYDDYVGGVRVFGHAGTVPGYQAWFDVYPSLNYIVIVLTNFDHPAARDAAWFVREHLTSASGTYKGASQ